MSTNTVLLGRLSHDHNASVIQLHSENLRTLQLKMLEVYAQLRDILDAAQLYHVVCGGGLIGALRHQGFIPWDDDLDIFMPRPHYEELMKRHKQLFEGTQLSLVRSPYPSFTSDAMAKVVDNSTTCIKDYQAHLWMPHGITLDILPLDAASNHRWAQKQQYVWALFHNLCTARHAPQNHGGFSAWVSTWFLRYLKNPHTAYKLQKKYEQRMQGNLSWASTNYVKELCSGPRYARLTYKSEWFTHRISLPFEQDFIYAPQGYHDYLSCAFGNYMELPPRAQQQPHHQCVILDMHTPWSEHHVLEHKNFFYEELQTLYGWVG